MINCSNCKYWKPPTPGWQGDDTGHGICLLFATEDGEVDGHALAYALDGEQYDAQLYTKPEFGCVSGESAEPANV